MAKKSRSYGVRDVLNWKFENESIPKVWLDHLGNLPKRFTMYVDGSAGHGKTDYLMQLSKMMSIHVGKVHLNNVEQGKHGQIQESARRNKFDTEVPPGKWIYSSIRDFESYNERISRPNSGRIQIIDSISFWPLNEKQIQNLFERFKYKSFVLVAYKAHFKRNEPIQHLCDIKVRVENFYAYPTSRFGGNEPFDIWPEKHKKKAQQPTLFETNGQEVNHG